MKLAIPTVLLLLMVANAGCFSNNDAKAASDSAEAPPVAYGALEGLVTDDEIRPLGNANVSLLGTDLRTVTEPMGSFSFPQVPEGAWTLRVDHERHESRELSVEIEPDGTQRVEVALPLLPSFAPYNRTLTFEGFYDCAHEVPIWTGDCMILYEAATNQSDPYTDESFTFQFRVDPRWDSFVMELNWQSGANNQLEGMRFYLEHATGNETDHSIKVGRADGSENPLRFVVHRGEPHPRAGLDPATGKPATFPVNGSTAQVRVFPHGRFYDEMCYVGKLLLDACLLGIGIGVDIKFTVYATVFYNGRAPDGFTAIAPRT